MFEKTMSNRDHGHEPETIIAASVKVEGDFASQGNVLIEGMVEGSLRTERDLRVGERARIIADVFAANAIVAGEIRGNLSVGERLELESTARVHGDVKTKVLVVASGAVINGKLQMTTEATERVATKSAERALEKESRITRAAKVIEPVAVVEKEEQKERAFAPFLSR